MHHVRNFHLLNRRLRMNDPIRIIYKHENGDEIVDTAPTWSVARKLVKEYRQAFATKNVFIQITENA